MRIKRYSSQIFVAGLSLLLLTQAAVGAGELDSLLRQAEQLEQNKQYQDAEPVCIKAKQTAVPMPDRAQHFRALLLLAASYDGQQKYSPAEDTYKSCLHELAAEPDEGIEMSVLDPYVRFLLNRNKNAEAIVLTDRLTFLQSQECERFGYHLNEKLPDLAKAFYAASEPTEGDKIFQALIEIQSRHDYPKYTKLKERLHLIEECVPFQTGRVDGCVLLPIVEQAIFDAGKGRSISPEEMGWLQGLLIQLSRRSGQPPKPVNVTNFRPDYNNLDKYIQIIEESAANTDSNLDPTGYFAQLIAIGGLHLQKHDLYQSLEALKQAIDLYKVLRGNDKNIFKLSKFLAVFGPEIADLNSERAITYWNEVIDLALAKDNPELFEDTLNDHDNYVSQTKQFAASALFYQHLLHRQEARFGVVSGENISFHKHLRLAYKQAHWYPQALQEQLQLCSMEKKLFKAAFPDEMIFLVDAYLQANDKAMANQTYDKALSAARAFPSGDFEPISFAALQSLFDTYQRLHMLAEADRVLVDSLYFCWGFMEAPHWQRIGVSNIKEQASRHITAKRYAAAESLLNHAIAELNKYNDENDVLQMQSSLANVYAYQNQTTKSLALFEKVRAHLAENFGDKSPEVWRCVKQEARALSKSGHKQESDVVASKFNVLELAK
ncbi:MAG TPA: hypothetical protein V6C69_14035 [Trichormus sp.]